MGVILLLRGSRRALTKRLWSEMWNKQIFGKRREEERKHTRLKELRYMFYEWSNTLCICWIPKFASPGPWTALEQSCGQWTSFFSGGCASAYLWTSSCQTIFTCSSRQVWGTWKELPVRYKDSTFFLPWMLRESLSVVSVRKPTP